MVDTRKNVDVSQKTWREETTWETWM